MNEDEWKNYAKNILKSELIRRGITYGMLVGKLNEMGVEETYNSVNNKINRGTFNFVFVLQCMQAIQAKEFRL